MNETCCSEFTLSRRSFLAGLGAITGTAMVSSMVGSAFVSTAYAATGAGTGTQNVLVVLSMRGGVDGMSLVVPHADPYYYEARQTIGIPYEVLLHTDSMFGLHPKLDPLTPLWTSGKLAAVHAVGLPAPNRSHFDATAEVEDAAPGSPLRNGWLNRLIGLDGSQISTEAAQMGSSISPISLWGEEPAIAIQRLELMSIAGPPAEEPMRRRVASLKQVWSDVESPLGQGSRAAMDVAQRLTHVVQNPEGPQHGAKYPTGDFGTALRESATLIRADVGATVITVDHGNWDMHAGLGTVDNGLMRHMAGEFAAALSAFFIDLGDVAERVTVVTVSEFGRRVAENASRGLDHGYGNVMFVAGAGVLGGKYYGNWPGLGSGQLIDGDLAVTRDYRSVLTEVLRSRFSADISKVFPGFKPERIGVMQGA